LESSVETLVLAAADRAAERSAAAWNAEPAGRTLLGKTALLHGDDLSRVSAQFPDAVAAMVRDWQGSVLELVRSQGADKRATARFLSYGVNGTGLLVMLVVFAHTGGLTGAEVGVAGGTSLLSQKILEAVFGDQAVRQLAADARHDLLGRVRDLLTRERRRYTQLLADEEVQGDAATALRAVLAELDDARSVAAAAEPPAAEQPTAEQPTAEQRQRPQPAADEPRDQQPEADEAEPADAAVPTDQPDEVTR
jgi:hypothetical protein